MAAHANGNEPRGATHPSRSVRTENRLDARHVTYTFEPNLPLAELRDVEGNQVRRSEHRAPKEMVERYAEQMKNGAVFPAIVVNDRRELVDGNTRWAAAKRVKCDAIPAYVCADLTELRARALSVELNQSHGLSMTEEEIRVFVESAIQEGQVPDTKAYARMTGTKPRTLARWIGAHDFRTRAACEGIAREETASLSESAQVALQQAKLKSVFVDATRLAIDAKVGAAQVKAIVREANAAPSEADALSIVAAAREARADEISVIAAGFKIARRKSAGSAPHIAGLLRFEPDDLVDVPPEKQQDAIVRMRQLHSRLGTAIERATASWSLPSASPASDRDEGW